MKKRTFFILVLIGFTLLTGAKVVWNAFHDSEDDPSEIFSDSSAEARRAGILVSDLIAEPSTVMRKGQALIIAEAWIEKCAVHRYRFVWFHRRVPTGGVTVIIKLKKSVEPRFMLWPPDHKESFGWIGGDYFVRYFETEPAFPMALDEGAGREFVRVFTLRRPN